MPNGLPWRHSIYGFGGGGFDGRRIPFGSQGGSPCDPGGGPCLVGGGSGLPTAPDGQYTTYGSCGCLAEDVEVALFDGGSKKASEVHDGDRLVAIVNGEERMQIARNCFERLENCVEIFHAQGSFVCSGSHRVMEVDGSPLTTLGVCPDEHSLVGRDGKPIKILSIANTGVRRVYGWSAYPDAVFVAGGVLHHNKTLPAEDILL